MIDSKDFIQIKNFIPREIWKLVFLAVIVGVLSFLVESSMIVILQGVLVSLGILSRESSNLPDFYPVTVVPAFLAVAAFGLFRSSSNFLKTHLAALAQHRFTRIVRTKALQIAVKNGNKVPHDEVVSYFSEIVTQCGNVILYINLLTSSVICTILLFILGLLVAPLEMIIGVISLALIAIPYARCSRTIKKSGEGLVYEWERINNVILIALKNNFFLKVFNLEKKEIAKGEAILADYEGHLRKYSFISSFFFSLPSFLGILVVCLITVIGKEYLQTESIKLLSFYYLFIRFSQFASESYSSFSFFSLNHEGVKKLSGWLRDHDIDLKNEPISQTKKLDTDEDVTIEINNLTFGYGNKPLFSDINLKLAKGDFLLIKGHSGSGKSTLLNLIFGLIAPSGGRVLINNKPKADNFSEIISYVGPEPYLIPGTVRENLLYGYHESITDFEMFDVLSMVGLGMMVEQFPNKLDQYLSDHAQISTGQRQRLAMARALLRKPKILIMDEATSNIDHSTEDRIIKILDDFKSQIITVAVTHKDTFDRLASHRLVLGE